MKDHNEPLIFGCWLAIAALVVSALIYFQFGTASGPTKRRMFRWYTAIGGIAIAVWFTLILGIAGLALAIVTFPLAALLSWRTTRFCDACGATMINQFTRAKFCPRCGADLDAQDQARKPA